MRVTLYVPDRLGQSMKEQLPDVNVSAVFQDALRALLTCNHDQVVCGGCGQNVDLSTIVGDALDHFWRELLWHWQPLVDRHGTAVGAAQIAKQVAVELGVPSAPRLAVPRPPRARAS